MGKDPYAKRFELQRLVERSLGTAKQTLAQQGSFPSSSRRRIGARQVLSDGGRSGSDAARPAVRPRGPPARRPIEP
jgi:hypothetical protein